MLKTVVVAIAGVGIGTAASAPPEWPPFLPAPDSFSAGVVASIERVWRAPTLTRTVEGPPAPVALKTYEAFLDAPDLTAAAARYLELAKYQVRMMDDDWYEADNGRGARGIYRVLIRTPRRRVVLSWGQHSGAILGTITGSALTVLEFEDRGGDVAQKLTAYVLIDNRVAALLARSLAPIFGYVIDRELSEGFRVTSRVAGWAVSRPDEFCPWLHAQEFAAKRAEPMLAAGGCATTRTVVRPHHP